MIDKTSEEFKAWNLKKSTWLRYENHRSKDEIQDDTAVRLLNVAEDVMKKANLLDMQFREKYPKGRLDPLDPKSIRLCKKEIKK